MRHISVLLSPSTCSLFARSANHGGTTTFNEDGTDRPNSIDADTYTDGGGTDVDVDYMSGGDAQTAKDPPFMLPLMTGGFILVLLCAMWFGWRWYVRRARIDMEQEDHGRVIVEQGDRGRRSVPSTRINPAPPKLWEVEINRVGPILRVSMDEEEDPKVRKWVLEID